MESSRLRALSGLVADETRGLLRHVLLAGPDAVASNGKALAFIKGAAPGLSGTRLVHGGIAAKVKPTDVVELNGQVIIRPKKGAEVTSKLVTEIGRYPDFKAVMPKLDVDAIELSIDATLLVGLAKALSRGESQKITIRIPAPAWGDVVTDPLLVKGADEQGIGVIMPIRSSTTDASDWRRRLDAVQSSENPTFV